MDENNESRYQTTINENNREIYVVQPGDTLSEILYDRTGNGSYAYASEYAGQYNIDNPSRIYVGQEIDLTDIPNRRASVTSNPTPTSTSTSTGSGASYSGSNGGSYSASSGSSVSGASYSGSNGGSYTASAGTGGSSVSTTSYSGSNGGSYTASTGTGGSTGDIELSMDDESKIESMLGGESETSNGTSGSTGDIELSMDDESKIESMLGGESGTSTGSGTSYSGSNGGSYSASTGTSGSGSNGTRPYSNPNYSYSGSNGGSYSASSGSGSNAGRAGGATTAGVSTAAATTAAASTAGGSYSYSGNSMYIICYPDSVKGWTPLNSFKTFIVKANAGESFVAVDQCVKNCVNDMDGVIKTLTKLKTTMGDNTGTTTQIDSVIKALNSKKEELVTKERELIQACNQVVEYIYANKASKSAEAAQVAQTISNIKLS